MRALPSTLRRWLVLSKPIRSGSANWKHSTKLWTRSLGKTVRPNLQWAPKKMEQWRCSWNFRSNWHSKMWKWLSSNRHQGKRWPILRVNWPHRTKNLQLKSQSLTLRSTSRSRWLSNTSAWRTTWSAYARPSYRKIMRSSVSRVRFNN